MRKPRFCCYKGDPTKICSPAEVLNKTDDWSQRYPNTNLIPTRKMFLFFCSDLSCGLIFPSELLTSKVGIQLCESTFLPTSPLPFPSHPTEVVCGNFQSTGKILEGNSRQKGNSDMFLFSLRAAVCSAPEKFRRKLLYWDYWDFLDERGRVST